MCDSGIYAKIGNDDDTVGSPWLRNSDCGIKCYDVFSGSTRNQNKTEPKSLICISFILFVNLEHFYLVNCLCLSYIRRSMHETSKC